MSFFKNTGLDLILWQMRALGILIEREGGVTHIGKTENAEEWGG